MLLKICRHIPFINTLIHYSWLCHKDAARKFGTLWVVSILPIILASILIAVGKAPQSTSALWRSVHAGLFATDQFIYAVSFLPAILYLVHEKLERRGQYIHERKRRPSADLDLPGSHWILWGTTIVLIFTAFAYGVTKADPSIQWPFLSASGLVVYVYAMYCWYITILDSITPTQSDYVGDGRKREDEMKGKFAERIRGRSGTQ